MDTGRVFISYDRDTRMQAHELASALRANGFDPWLSDYLQPGLPIRMQIEAAAHDAHWFAFLISSTGQPVNFSEPERMAALKSVWADSSKGILPVLFGTQSLPPFLQGWQALKADDIEGEEVWTERAVEILRGGDTDSQRAGVRQVALNRQRRERRLSELSRALSAVKEASTSSSLRASLAE